jgi:hypothetical protein
MRKEKFLRYSSISIVFVTVIWIALTIYAELSGPPKQWNMGNASGKKVLVVFDPDPFYNLDEKVCLSFAKALGNNEMSVAIVTVAAAEGIDRNKYNAFIYCANTYNWRPDWSITNYIEQNPAKQNQSIVAITLGAGSTDWSRQNFEEVIKKSGGQLLQSYSLWLWRPNDETKMESPNVEVAESMAYQWGTETAIRLKQ